MQRIADHVTSRARDGRGQSHDQNQFLNMLKPVAAICEDAEALVASGLNRWVWRCHLKVYTVRKDRMHGQVRARDVKVSRPTWSRDHFFGLGLGLGVTVIGLGLGLGLMRYWSRVSYVLVSWSRGDYLLF